MSGILVWLGQYLEGPLGKFHFRPQHFGTGHFAIGHWAGQGLSTRAVGTATILRFGEWGRSVMARFGQWGTAIVRRRIS